MIQNNNLDEDEDLENFDDENDGSENGGEDNELGEENWGTALGEDDDDNLDS